MNARSRENILVIGPSWVGDMVMAQSLFMLLRRQNPGCTITVLAPDWTRALLDRMPEVSAAIPARLDHGELALGKRRRIGRDLRRENFTQAIVLPNSFKSALIPFHAGIPRRIGWRGEWRQALLNDCRTLDKDSFPRMLDRFAALAFDASDRPPAAVPYPALVTDAGATANALGKLSLHLDYPILSLCPGAEFGESKQWPPEHFAELANEFLRKGWQIWLFGSANDRIAAESVMADVENEFLDRVEDLTGRTMLGEAIDLLARSAAVVSNDSGLMHIAAALGKPLVALYGSTSTAFTPPLAERVKSLHTDIECRPCFKRECPLGHKRCLKELSPHRVASAVVELAADPE